MTKAPKQHQTSDRDTGEATAAGQEPATPPRNPYLSARDLTAGYRPPPNAPQIDSVSLDLAPAELVAVIGPNGSGKSTLLRLLSRTLPPRSGVVLIGEADLYSELSPRISARSIAVVPQTPDVFLDFTVRDIVAMGRAPHRAERGFFAADTQADDTAVADALSRAGIGGALAARPISQVSGGERQRALIARSLAQEAPILLLDEPVSALDPRHQRRLLGWLRKLAERENRTIVAVLHDLNAAAEFADRMIVLSQGRIVADGATSAVLTSELIQNVYGVRSWIRSNPATGRLCVLPAEPIDASVLLAESERSGIKEGDDNASGGGPCLHGLRVHLFCGGGTGARLMFTLARLGATLTACALHEGDADLDAARALNIPHATAPAFSRPSRQAAQTAADLASEADAAILTAVERGEINGELFEQAALFAASGRPLVNADGEGKSAVDHVTESLRQLLAEQERTQKTSDRPHIHGEDP